MSASIIGAAAQRTCGVGSTTSGAALEHERAVGGVASRRQCEVEDSARVGQSGVAAASANVWIPCATHWMSIG